MKAILLAVIALLLGFLTGCKAGSEAQFVGTRSITVYDTFGNKIYDQTWIVDGSGKTVAPSDASSASPVHADFTGVGGESSASWVTTANDLVAARSGTIFYTGSLIFLAAGIALFFVPVIKNIPLAIGCGVAAGVCAFAPTLINTIGPPVAWFAFAIIVLSVIAAAIWALASWRGKFKASNEEKDRIVSRAVELAKSGDPAGAIHVALSMDRWQKAAAEKP